MKSERREDLFILKKVGTLRQANQHLKRVVFSVLDVKPPLLLLNLVKKFQVLLPLVIRVLEVAPYGLKEGDIGNRLDVVPPVLPHTPYQQIGCVHEGQTVYGVDHLLKLQGKPSVY